MPPEEFIAEYSTNGGWPEDFPGEENCSVLEESGPEGGEDPLHPEPEYAEAHLGPERAPAAYTKPAETPYPARGGYTPAQPPAQAIEQARMVELLGRMFGFVEKLMDEVRRQNDALARAVESLNAAVERLQSPGRTAPPRAREAAEDIRSLSRIYDSQPRTFSLMERERIVRKARETLEVVEEELVLPPIERAAVVDGDVLDEPVLEPPERAFASTPEHMARYLGEMEAGPEKEKVEVPDVSGLPSFFQGNPWVAILARRAREAGLVDEYEGGRRFFAMMKDEGKISEEDYKGVVLLLTATSRMPDLWNRLNDSDFVPDGEWTEEEIERARRWKPPTTENGWPLRTTWMIHPGSVPTLIEDTPLEVIKRRWEHFKKEGRLPSDEEIMEEIEEEEYRLRCRLFGKLRADDWRAIREWQKRVEREGNPFLKWLDGEDEF